MRLKKSLKDKKILISAGPTWVAIDSVRVITNIFSGRTGYDIAREASLRGANVKLLLGPGRLVVSKAPENLKIVRFKYFDELLNLMKTELKIGKYDAVIHSAAIADYVPVKPFKGKIKSKKNSLSIRLKPTLKIVDLIKKMDPTLTLVKFKLETNVSKKTLINVAYDSMVSSHADFIVANTLEDFARNRKAYIIDKHKNVVETKGNTELSQVILNTIF